MPGPSGGIEGVLLTDSLAMWESLTDPWNDLSDMPVLVPWRRAEMQERRVEETKARKNAGPGAGTNESSKERRSGGSKEHGWNKRGGFAHEGIEWF